MRVFQPLSFPIPHHSPLPEPVCLSSLGHCYRLFIFIGSPSVFSFCFFGVFGILILVQALLLILYILGYIFHLSEWPFLVPLGPPSLFHTHSFTSPVPQSRPLVPFMWSPYSSYISSSSILIHLFSCSLINFYVSSFACSLCSTLFFYTYHCYFLWSLRSSCYLLNFVSFAFRSAYFLEYPSTFDLKFT